MEGLLRSFWAVLGGIFRSRPLTSQKLPLCGNQPTECISGQFLRSLLPNPHNFSEVAPEVRLVVHTALLCFAEIAAISETRESSAALRFEGVQWKVASDLRFGVAVFEPKTPSFCRISGDLAPSTRKSLAIAIVQFWCAKRRMVRKSRPKTVGNRWPRAGR